MGDGNRSTESIAAISRRATEDLYREYIFSLTASNELDAEINADDGIENDFKDNDPENEANPYAHALLDSDESLLNKLSHAKYYLNGTERRSKSLGGSTKNITRIVPVVQVTLSPPQVVKEPDRRITGASKRLYNPELYKKKEKNYARTIDSHHILYKNIQLQKEKKRKEKLTKSLPTSRRKLVEEKDETEPVVTLFTVSQLLGEKPKTKRIESLASKDELKLPLQKIEKSNLVVPEISITLPTPHQKESRPEGSLTVEELLAAADDDLDITEDEESLDDTPTETQEPEIESHQEPALRSSSPKNIELVKEIVDEEEDKRKLQEKIEAEEKLRIEETERERKKLELEEQLKREEKAQAEEEARKEKERKRLEQLKKEEEERKREEEKVEFERKRAESRARREEEKRVAEEAEKKKEEEALLAAKLLEEEKREQARKKELEAKKEAEEARKLREKQELALKKKQEDEEKARLDQERKQAEEEAKRKAAAEEEAKRKQLEDEGKKKELAPAKSIADIKKELQIAADSVSKSGRKSPSPKLSPTSRETSKPSSPTAEQTKPEKLEDPKVKKGPFKSEELMLKLDTMREETSNELKKTQKDVGKVNSLKSSDEKKKTEPEEPKNELSKIFEKLRKSDEKIENKNELRKSTSLLVPVSVELSPSGSNSMPTSPNMRKPSPRPLAVIAETEGKKMSRAISVEELINSIEQKNSPPSPRQRKSSLPSKEMPKPQSAPAPRKASLTATSSQKTLTRSTSDLSKMAEEEDDIKQGKLWLLVDHNVQSALDTFSCQKFTGWTQFFCSIQDTSFNFFEAEPIFDPSPPLVNIPANDATCLHISNTKTKEYSFTLDERDGKQLNIQFNSPFWFVLVVNQKYMCISVESFTDFVKWKKLLKTSLSKTNIVQQKIWDDEGPY